MIEIAAREAMDFQRIFRCEYDAPSGLRSNSGWMRNVWACVHGDAGCQLPRCRADYERFIMVQSAPEERPARRSEDSAATVAYKHWRKMKGRLSACSAHQQEILAGLFEDARRDSLVPAQFALLQPHRTRTARDRRADPADNEDGRQAVLESFAAATAFQAATGIDLRKPGTLRVVGEHSRLLSRWLRLLVDLMKTRKPRDVELLVTLTHVPTVEVASVVHRIVRGAEAEALEALGAAGCDATSTRLEARRVGLEELAVALRSDKRTVRAELQARQIPLRRLKLNNAWSITVASLERRWPEAAHKLALAAMFVRQHVAA